MAKSRSKKTKGGGFDWRAAGSVCIRVVAVALLIALALGLTIGVDKMRARASDILASGSDGGDPLAVAFNWPPLAGDAGGTWLPEDDQAALISAVRWAASSRGALTPSRVRAVSATLAQSGWFEGEPVVRLSGPNAVSVTGDWRTPMAVVRWTFPGAEVPHDVLISDDAMRMPPQWRVPPDRPAGVSGRPVILGCAEPPPADTKLGGRYTTPWAGPDIRAGLDLIGVLISAGLAEHVVGVDVGDHWRGGPLEIVARGSAGTPGGRIVWGSAPSEWKSGEPSVAERVSRLRGLIDTRGRIDGGERRISINTDLVEIDLTGEADGND